MHLIKKTIAAIIVSLFTGIIIPSTASDFKSIKNLGEGEGHCSLVEGSLSVLAENEPFRLVFDFSETNFASYDRKSKQFTEPRPLMEYLAVKGEDVPDNWPELEESIRSFSSDIIGGQKTYKLYLDENAPKYEMRMVFDNINFGSTAETMTLRAFGIGGAAFGGNLIITDIATGAVVLNLRLDYAYCVSSMGYHYTVNKRLQCVIGDFFFGKYLPAIYKKNK